LECGLELPFLRGHRGTGCDGWLDGCALLISQCIVSYTIDLAYGREIRAVIFLLFIYADLHTLLWMLRFGITDLKDTVGRFRIVPS